MDIPKDRQNTPCILQDIVPLDEDEDEEEEDVEEKEEEVERKGMIGD